ncbi:MAG TPA: PQQ-dependent sugar dehydrogenase [Pirellulales bacterium]|nr:PQQ-dependent sugar dehydrogenase [Pirellulales bacterium]
MKPTQSYFVPMTSSALRLTAWLAFIAALAVDLRAEAPTPQTFGLETRVPWTTSNVRGSPDPPAPYRIRPAFANLKFYEPLALLAAAEGNRFFVAERPGSIYSFANDPQTNERELFLDLKKTIYGLAFHPNFKENRNVYVTYLLDPNEPDERGTRVSRFTADADNPLHCDPTSEQVVIEWPSGGHNGGCLKFGPDGYLYIVTGDGSGIADERQTGQDLSDLLAAILRIDVDHPDPGKHYGIPSDNPFVTHEGARGEIWAYGVRQVWKMSFDRETGDLWGGEVGQDLWESVLRIERGGNYGWSMREGSHPFRPERPVGPTPIVGPVAEHHHAAFRSLTGGYVYRGHRLQELRGAYVYGDYDTGRVWALRYDGRQVTWQQELVDTPLRIVDFGEDRQGEIYLLDFMGGTIYELEPAPARQPAPEFPRKLSETGLFASTSQHRPAPGLIPYSVNAPLWSDHAYKERFLALPGDSQIVFDGVEYPQPAPGAPRGWRFPDGTVAVKTFSLEMERGNPASRRRLETRILHFEQLAGSEEVGDQYWRGYTYVWNDDQTDAELLDAAGADRTYTIADPSAPGGRRDQTWHFPSRAECTLCHTMPAKFVLGLNTLQMNKDHDYGGLVANQLATLEHLGVLSELLPARPDQLPKLADYAASEPGTAPRPGLDARARSYLHSNCSHCHMKWGGGNADFQLLATLALDEMGIVGVRPGHGSFGIADARLLVPGDPSRSMILLRMTKLGLGRMPHVASLVVDEPAVKLIHDWIEQLSAKQ